MVSEMLRSKDWKTEELSASEHHATKATCYSKLFRQWY